MKRSAAKRILKGFGIILGALVLVFGLELGREKLVYRSISKRIESAHRQLKPGMTKSEVQTTCGRSS